MDSDSYIPIREMQSKLKIWQTDFKDLLQNPKHKCSWGILHPKLHSNRKTEKKKKKNSKKESAKTRIKNILSKDQGIKISKDKERLQDKKAAKLVHRAQQRSAWELFQQQYQWESLQNKLIKKIGRNHQL